MPSRADLRWSELKVGILIAAAAIILVLVIFALTGQSGFFTHKITLLCYLDDAGGMLPGAQVQLQGVTIGNVNSVGLVPSPPNPQYPVKVEMQVVPQSRWLRTDSLVELGTAGPLGEALINITAGTLQAPPAQNGTVLKEGPPGGINELMVSSRDVIDRANDILNQLAGIVDQVQKGQGAIGKLLYSDELYDRFDKVAGNLEVLTNNINAGQGTIGKLLSSEDTYNKVNGTLDNLNRTMDAIQNGNGTVGKMMTDPALYNNANDLIHSLQQTVDALNSGQGAMGALLTNSPTSAKLKDTLDRLNALVTTMQSGPGTIAKLLNDPKLYNELTATSAEAESLMQAIRTNPRKYLTIHLNIF